MFCGWTKPLVCRVVDPISPIFTSLSIPSQLDSHVSRLVWSSNGRKAEKCLKRSGPTYRYVYYIAARARDLNYNDDQYCSRSIALNFLLSSHNLSPTLLIFRGTSTYGLPHKIFVNRLQLSRDKEKEYLLKYPTDFRAKLTNHRVGSSGWPYTFVKPPKCADSHLWRLSLLL